MHIAVSAGLFDALKACSDVERALVAIGKRLDADRKLDLVQLRRRFSEQIGKLGLVIEADAELAKVPEQREEMGRLFSAFRYAIAQHQARWPAVLIDEDVEGYSASARVTYAKSDQFWDWCVRSLNLDRSAHPRATSFAP